MEFQKLYDILDSNSMSSFSDYLKNEISKFSYDKSYQKTPDLIHLGEMSHLKTEITSLI